MAKTLLYEDVFYPKSDLARLRRTVRGICFGKDGKIALHVVSRDDIFGKARYYELPGGGVKEGESDEAALIREIEEELGMKGSVGEKFYEVWDAYNLIHQENRISFYLFELKEAGEKHISSRGDLLIERTIFVTLEEALALYEGQEDTPIGNLVRRRELPVLKSLLGRPFSAL